MISIGSILVLCTGNICRSPMAEAVLRRALASRRPAVEVASAGIAAVIGAPADETARALMGERGLDIGAHRGTQLDLALGARFDLLLVMEAAQREYIEMRWPALTGRVYTLGHWGRFEIDDPYRKDRAAFEAALDGIDRGIGQWLPRLADLRPGAAADG